MVTTTRFAWTSGRTESPTQRIAHPMRAPAAPIGSAQRSVAMVGATSGGTEVRARENVPRPVQLSRPMKTRAPIPEARSPGRATRVSVAPAMPAASMMRNAPSRGEPNNVLIAAKLPAEAMIVTAIGGASFLTSRTVRAARPPPTAMSGASGPSTAPRLNVASEASTTPGRSRSRGGAPPMAKPSAGEWPALPGRCRMAKAVSRPASATHGNGHQAGAEPANRSPGRSVNSQSCSFVTRTRKPYATAEIGAPRMAASTRADRYALDRITVLGSIGGGAPGSAPAAGTGAGRSVTTSASSVSSATLPAPR